MARPPHPTLVALIAAASLLAACSRPTPTPDEGAPTAALHVFDGAITGADFSEHVKHLASDAFEGRAPGSAGEERTVEYLKAEFVRLGLKPGNGDSYFQTVPMVETIADQATVLRLDVAGKPREFRFGDDMVVGTRSGETRVKLDHSDLVFVGYGVHAPERGWNDYASVDVKGKTVVILVNDPGFHTQDPKLFDGKRMTYYGRWTYKFEEAARQGAAAALLIHDSAGAAYGWDVVRNGWSGSVFELLPKDDPDPRLPVQGWLTGDAARRLFDELGLDLDVLYKAANQPGFRAIPLKAALSVDLNSTIAHKSSRNVIAVLPGSTRSDEAIVYMAHWDHLGRHEGETGDNIYNGAIDNATGVAGILEIAGAFAKQTPAPERSLLFLAVTLEESGLLGSRYYVSHPSVPLEKTVAVVNLDAMPVIGKARDMTVIGYGSSELEDILKRITDEQGRVLRAEATPEDGFYFRSDHFNFARAGVPSLYAKGGADLVGGGLLAGRIAQVEYRDDRYHKPSDEFDAAWKLEGVLQDIEALHGVGRELAGNDQWPQWHAGSAFRAAHERLVKPARQ